MYDVKDRLARDAHIAGMAAYKARYDRCAADPDDYWLGEAKQRLTWFVEPEVALQGGYQHLDFTWFAGGKLNASYQCIDRHLITRGDKTAIIWDADEVGVYEQTRRWKV